jgi:UDP-N-acetylglucosamine 3-dehydrogenase
VPSSAKLSHLSGAGKNIAQPLDACAGPRFPELPVTDASTTMSTQRPDPVDLQPPVSVLIAGAGTMARVHGQALADIPGAKLAGIVNERLASARRLASELGTRSFMNLKQALGATDARAIFVCLPTPLHRSIVIEAARAGLHVFCEKPIARSAHDAEAIIGTCEQAEVVLMIGHVLRFFPQYARLHDLVTAGEIGQPATARLSRGGAAPRGSRDWYANRGHSGGVLLDLTIHDFDWLRWTFGPVVRVHARQTAPLRGKLASYVLAVLRHENGVISHVEGYWGHELPFRTRVEVAGDKGALDYDSVHPIAVELYQGDHRSDRAPVVLPESPLGESPYRSQDAHFIDCIRRRARPVLVPGDAFEALRISLACLSSARTGEAVCL